jgi:hypothetical protein
VARGGGRALVEIACTRTPAQLFAAKQAYHDRFKRSLEEDVAAHVTGEFRKVRRHNSQPRGLTFRTTISLARLGVIHLDLSKCRLKIS